MKATLVFFFGVLISVSAMAQGKVNFANNSLFPMTTNSTPFPPPGQSPNATGNTQLGYRVGLYIAPQGTTDPNAFTLIGPTASSLSGISPGTFNGNGGDEFMIPGNSGQTIAFQVRAWSEFAGATYETAGQNPFAYRGTSAIGEVTPTTGAACCANLFGTSTGKVGGFVLYPGLIPEPSTNLLFLVGLGFGLIVLKRPRRRQL